MTWLDRILAWAAPSRPNGRPTPPPGPLPRQKPPPKPQIPQQRPPSNEADVDEGLAIFGPRAAWGPADDGAEDYPTITDIWREVPVRYFESLDRPSVVAAQLREFRGAGLDMMARFEALDRGDA